MKKVGILFLSWGLLMVFTSLTFAVEPLKIAYVDMQKALNYCEAGKEAKRQMTLEVEKMQKVFAGKQKELEKIKVDLEKRGSVLSENVRREKDRDYQTKLRDLQRLQKDYEDDLRRKDREFTERILKNVEVIIKQMGEEGKYTVILEKNQPTILFISNSLDLTEEVIKRIDQKQK
ncbi:MAG: OmpH family outer membrane protein [Deltaproteobacteria bacterium]|nr:OmpH family outer membrane protein [Deltaproteobacteria bacterium]